MSAIPGLQVESGYVALVLDLIWIRFSGSGPDLIWFPGDCVHLGFDVERLDLNPLAIRNVSEELSMSVV